MIVLGLISGTSHDGIDAAVVEFGEPGEHLTASLLYSSSTAYSPELRARTSAALPPALVSLQEVCELDTLIGQSFAHTALISCNPRATVANLADSHIVLQTGAEVVTGSTRLKAGSAEKMVLNGFSTALMVAYGRTWSNLMVSLVATNAKLRDRTLRILADATGARAEECEALLRAANGDLKVAIVAPIGDMSTEAARKALDVASGSVRGALEANATLPASLNSNQIERQQ